MSTRKLVVTPDPSHHVDTFYSWPSLPSIATPVSVRFAASAYREAHQHVCRGLLESEGGEQSTHRMEVKGALLGTPARLAEESGFQVWVHRAIPLPLLATDSPTSCVYRARDKVEIDILCDRQYGGLQVVGWFHSHPALRVFLSDIDRLTMEESFPLAHHIALVIDPVFDEAAFFVWDKGRIDQRARECFVPSTIVGPGSHFAGGDGL